MSFGKRQRLPRPSASIFDEELGGMPGFIGGRTPEEFSDESLFGEDRLEDLLEKKGSQKGGNIMGESFRSKPSASGKNFAGLFRADENS